MIDWLSTSLGVTADTVVNTLGMILIGILTIGVAIWATRRGDKNGIAVTKDASAIALDIAKKYTDKLESENAQLRNDLAGQDTQAENALAAAIEDLAEDAETADDRAPFDQAISELAEGRADAAEDLFQEILNRRKAEGHTALKEAAEAARHIGAIAFYHDTQKALAAYGEATELDPDDAEAWNQLGHLQHRIGNLAAAEAAYQNILRLGNSVEDKSLLAVAYGNLGVVFKTRGDLGVAEDMYRKALALNEELGRKEGMANQYGNLGVVFRARGDLDDAEDMYRKSLALNEELGSKEGMANQYGNLGNVFKIRDDLAEACRLWELSRGLFTEIGMAPQVEQVEGLMSDAGCESD